MFVLKKHYFYLIMALVFSAMSPQVAAELKIGFVNAIKVMDKAPQVEKANKRLEREFAPRQRRLIRDSKRLKKLEERRAKNAAIMSEPELRKLTMKIRDQQRELKRKQEEFREDYNFRRNEELNKIQKIISEVIQNLAKRERYDLILSDGVVWAGKRIDMTNKVLSSLRKKSR
jgi:outer membrane protein